MRAESERERHAVGVGGQGGVVPGRIAVEEEREFAAGGVVSGRGGDGRAGEVEREGQAAGEGAGVQNFVILAGDIGDGDGGWRWTANHSRTVNGLAAAGAAGEVRDLHGGGLEGADAGIELEINGAGIAAERTGVDHNAIGAGAGGGDVQENGQSQCEELLFHDWLVPVVLGDLLGDRGSRCS